jgi:hypothetical protein
LVFIYIFFYSFRQIAGQKMWCLFISPSETPYLIPRINVNGFSAHTMTKIGKNNDMSPWFIKVKRFTSTLNPGDVLINPPWFWHGVLNLGEPNQLSLLVLLHVMVVEQAKDQHFALICTLSTRTSI